MPSLSSLPDAASVQGRSRRRPVQLVGAAAGSQERRSFWSGVWFWFDAAWGWTAGGCTVGMHETIIGGQSTQRRAPARAPCSRVEMRDCLRLFGRRLTTMEVSGAMGDLGTYIPIVVALSIQCVTDSRALCLCGCADVLASQTAHDRLALLCSNWRTCGHALRVRVGTVSPSATRSCCRASPASRPA